MSKNGRDPALDPVIVAAKRTAVGKAKRGAFATVRPEDLAAEVIKNLVEITPKVEAKDIEDVLIGCAMPEGSQGLNMGRLIVLRAGFHYRVDNRDCVNQGVHSSVAWRIVSE